MNIKSFSPVSQDFIWVAEYADGTFVSEYDFNTKENRNFYSIQRDRLVRFGLIGQGNKLYFEVFGGVFKLNGQMIEILYREGNNEYFLTGQPKMYKDIITYKNAEAYFQVSNFKEGGGAVHRITQYNFGYKIPLLINGVNFNFRPIFMLPYNKPAYLSIRLVADKDMDGQLIIRVDNFRELKFDAPLRRGVAGELNWEVVRNV